MSEHPGTSAYEFDPELAEIAALAVNPAPTDPVAAREQMVEMMATLQLDLDVSGLDIEDRAIPGPPGEPDVTVRVYSPKTRAETASMQQFHDTPMWSRPAAEKSWEWYLGDAYGTDDVSPYAAPARATDVSGLPPAYISTMEFDPLRDEGIHYALKLMEAGVQVELHSFPGTFHGSAMVTHAAVTKREGVERFVVLRRALGLDGS